MTNLSAALLLAASAVLMGISNLCLKWSIERLQFSVAPASFVRLAYQPVFIVGFLLFGLASLAYIRILRSVSLSIAYPVFVGVAIAVVALGGIILFGERLSVPKVLGSGFLIAGIALISRG